MGSPEAGGGIADMTFLDVRHFLRPGCERSFLAQSLRFAAVPCHAPVPLIVSEEIYAASGGRATAERMARLLGETGSKVVWDLDAASELLRLHGAEGRRLIPADGCPEAAGGRERLLLLARAWMAGREGFRIGALS